MKNKSNIIKFLPPMAFNHKFIEKFIEESIPCAALGIVETAGMQKGFLAFKPDMEFTASTGQNGFDLGSELLGTSSFATLHFILNFGGEHIYDIFFNLNSPVVKRVSRVWEQTGEYFFFAFHEGGFTAFNQTLENEWYEYNYFGMIEKATNTDSAYENAVDKIIKRKDMLHGKPIHLVFQDDVDLLDLTEHRFEIKSHLE